eukprot:921521-Lingulodinium_polyedra.AAC.1
MDLPPPFGGRASSRTPAWLLPRPDPGLAKATGVAWPSSALRRSASPRNASWPLAAPWRPSLSPQ